MLELQYIKYLKLWAKKFYSIGSRTFVLKPLESDTTYSFVMTCVDGTGAHFSTQPITIRTSKLDHLIRFHKLNEQFLSTYQHSPSQ